MEQTLPFLDKTRIFLKVKRELKNQAQKDSTKTLQKNS